MAQYLTRETVRRKNTPKKTGNEKEEEETATRPKENKNGKSKGKGEKGATKVQPSRQSKNTTAGSLNEKNLADKSRKK